MRKQILAAGTVFRAGTVIILAAAAELLFVAPSAGAEIDLSVYDCSASSTVPVTQRHLGQIIQGQFYDYVEDIVETDRPRLKCINVLSPKLGPLDKASAQDFLNRSRAVGAPNNSGAERPGSSDSQELDPASLEKFKPIPNSTFTAPARQSERPANTTPNPSDMDSKGTDAKPEGGLSPSQPRQRPPDLEKQSSFTVPLSKDTRDRAVSTNSYPLNTVGYLGLYFYNSAGLETSDGDFRCSATLVSPYVALTAGHCIHNNNFQHNDGFADRAEFAPGQNQTSFGASVSRPFGSKSVQSFRTTTRWTEISGPDSFIITDYRYDIAAVFFSQPFTYTSTFLPIRYGESGSVNRFGYPGTVQGQSNNQGLWHSYGPETGVSSSQLQALGMREFSLVTSPGDSGGPFVAYFSATDSYELVGSVSYGNECSPDCRSGGPWYSSTNQSLISQWQSYTPGTGSSGGTFALTVGTIGTGSVLSFPTGIFCPGVCTANFNSGQQVVLTPFASYGWTFSGWSGSCSGAGTCSVSMTTARTVTATFTQTPIQQVARLLSVSVIGSGSGTVLSSPSGISCGTTCSANFSDGQVATLSATPAQGSIFSGWSGACSGTATCSVTMNATRFVTANFTKSPNPILTIAKGGNGLGTVTSSPAGINCGAACNISFTNGQTTTLSATPDQGSIFSGWSGACRGSSTCTLTMDTSKTATATFTRSSVLNVSLLGDGDGVVNSSPYTGINCGTACGGNFAGGEIIFLEATRSPGSIFEGWGGACAGIGVCALTMYGDVNVTAKFTKGGYPLNISIAGEGRGTIISAPNGINCGTACTANFAPSTTVLLTATAAEGSTFLGWMGPCSGGTGCLLGMNSAKDVIARIAQNVGTLNVSVSGNGAVSSAPGGVNCSRASPICNAGFVDGQIITLSATPAQGEIFAGWGGACGGVSACEITFHGDTNVTAAFAPKPILTVKISGKGTVTSSPSAIDCGSSCSADFPSGQAVKLTFAPQPGWKIGSAGGAADCVDPDKTCTVTVNGTTIVPVVFVTNAPAKLLVASVFSSAQPGSQSFLRFTNTDTSSGTVTVAINDYSTGRTIGEWTSPLIPPGTAKQYPISDIESGIGQGFAKPDYYLLGLRPNFIGYFQHVLWRSSDGTLTNLSTCSSGVTSTPARLTNVHSSLLGNVGYPSSIVVNNSGSEPAGAAVGFYDAATGQRLGTWGTPIIYNGSQLVASIASIESLLNIRTNGNVYHYVIKFEVPYKGFLQHLVTNTQAGVITDMTTVCALDGAASAAVPSPLQIGAIYSTAQEKSQSFLRFYNPGALPGAIRVSLRNQSGDEVGQWATPAISAGAAVQYSIAEIEKGTGRSFAKPDYYTIKIDSSISGYFQHVLWRSTDGTLTNLSTCSGGVTANAGALNNVHSSTLGNIGYPSSIAIINMGSAAASASLGVYDAATGSKLGAYATPLVQAGGEYIAGIPEIEMAAAVSPETRPAHYVVKLEDGFTGFLQHLLLNTKAGVVTDMTTLCQFPKTQ